ncbi:hypothetical protein AURDEDRAFT_172314 [Auricularia subglabra TFB-10046 SS5]|nr:hypothetical protein AURDEDRAFT_172314 [Auricularia subglabra TFB-10046 SS5]
MKKCPVCDIAFESEFAYKMHVDGHGGDDPRLAEEQGSSSSRRRDATVCVS